MAAPVAEAAGAVRRWTEISWSPYVHDARLNGRRLRYLDYGESGSPVVLIHGLGGSWQTWLEVIPRLGAQRRVIGVDLPGFGHSEPLPAPAEIATHAETLLALLDMLGVRRAVLVAHSMGGLVALAMAGARPELVDRLVLVDAGGVALGRAHLAAITGGFRAAYKLFGRPSVMTAVARRPRLRRAFLAGFVADASTLSRRLAAEVIPLMAAPGFVAAVAAAGRAAGDVKPQDVGCPVLLIWGERDRILPVALAERLAAALPDARLEVLPGVGHCPMFEAPEKLSELLLS